MVAIVRRFAWAGPLAELNLAYALEKLSSALAENGRATDAWSVVEDAIEICRQHTGSRLVGYRIELIRTLCMQADILMDLECPNAAAGSAVEAFKLCHAQLGRDPRRFGPMLVVALDSLGRAFFKSDNPRDARVVAEELVRILRAVAARRPAYEPALATALHQLGTYAFNAKQTEEALRAMNESVDVYRQLAEQQPERFAERLAAVSGSRDVILRFLEEWGP
ncbi:tetratricopeptide repeat protein [Nocardia heshunensis]